MRTYVVWTLARLLAGSQLIIGVHAKCCQLLNHDRRCTRLQSGRPCTPLPIGLELCRLVAVESVLFEVGPSVGSSSSSSREDDVDIRPVDGIRVSRQVC